MDPENDGDKVFQKKNNKKRKSTMQMQVSECANSQGDSQTMVKRKHQYSIQKGKCKAMQ